MCVLPLHNPWVLIIYQSILMPPPAKPSSKRFLRRPLHRVENGQRSTPFFLNAKQNGATKTALQASQKRDLVFDDEADKPIIIPRRAVPTNKQQNNNSRENPKVRCEAKEPAKSSTLQVVGSEYKKLSHIGSGGRPQQSSVDLDYEERRLYDRVSREEASVFRSAKSYGQSVEKRRKLGD